MNNEQWTTNNSSIWCHECTNDQLTSFLNHRGRAARRVTEKNCGYQPPTFLLTTNNQQLPTNNEQWTTNNSSIWCHECTNDHLTTLLPHICQRPTTNHQLSSCQRSTNNDQRPTFFLSTNNEQPPTFFFHLTTFLPTFPPLWTRTLQIPFFNRLLHL